MITQLWCLSLAKQRNICITVEHRAIRIALSLHGTCVCSKEITFEVLCIQLPSSANLILQFA